MKAKDLRGSKFRLCGCELTHLALFEQNLLVDRYNLIISVWCSHFASIDSEIFRSTVPNNTRTE